MVAGNSLSEWQIHYPRRPILRGGVGIQEKDVVNRGTGGQGIGHKQDERALAGLSQLAPHRGDHRGEIVW